MKIDSVSREFFDEKYRGDPDPWNFSASPYELNRYDRIVEILGSRTFDRGFEPGCSIGVLTERLAPRCHRLLAMDISPTAVHRAREHCAQQPNITIVEGALPEDLPSFTFDLIVFSEIGYYFERETLSALRDALIARLSNQGLLVGVHWLGVSEDHLLSGDEVHDILRSTKFLRLTASHRHERFLLEAWEHM